MGSFLWYIENQTNEPVEVSLMFTWQAGSGLFSPNPLLLIRIFSFLASDEFQCQGVSHQAVHISEDDLSATGVSIKQTLRDMNLEYCILAKKEVCSEQFSWKSSFVDLF